MSGNSSQIRKELMDKQAQLLEMARQLNHLLSQPKALHTDDYDFLKTQYRSAMRELQEMKEKLA
jgi:hypothetical protein